MKSYSIGITAGLILLLPLCALGAETRTETVLSQAEYRAKVLAENTALRQSLTAKVAEGNADAMLVLGGVTEQGDEAEAPDRKAAMVLYEKAADKGQKVARQKMCSAYLRGDTVKADVAKAATYCNTLGIKDPVGLFWLGYDLQNGVTGPKDVTQAMQVYAEAVKLGSGEAAVALGQEALNRGKPGSARGWFRRGVYLGSMQAMENLARMADAGEGGPVDKVEANWLYAHAARLGSAVAAEKVKALGNQNVPLIRMAGEGKTQMNFTRVYGDTDKSQTEILNFSMLHDLLFRNFSPKMLVGQPEARSHIECYVASDHRIDVCVIREDFPVGQGFARILDTLFSGHMTLPDKDARGEPTANRLFALRLKWSVQ
ncbi:tetratricopeptide repeat protein [Asticcacaulis sp. YBE204]|uniref:tetratricopeptide repeat protein n=1 Tax=Asticcacaulis sp. YBE204 TaxID=1282363 RepID=UPI0003C3EC7F|nr:tetratricopeptide repeat protein [Asticcacaulis sp. YBE204]ESQ78992.1 hypothetical protein AEYBE204_11250 [Asticcacaulis sp. YBE204]